MSPPDVYWLEFIRWGGGGGGGLVLVWLGCGVQLHL